MSGALPVRFEQAELNNLSDLSDIVGRVDAVVGRYVLCHQPDPSAALRRFAQIVRPGGLIVFLEPEFNLSVQTFASLPETRRCAGWLVEICRRAGMQMNTGTQFSRIFHDAGLPWPETHLHLVFGGGPEYRGYQHYADTLDSLLPLGEKLGVVTRAEACVDGMAERLRREVLAEQTGLISCVAVGAWVRIPE